MTHLNTTRRPMTEARRNAVHGPLRSAEEPDDSGPFHLYALAYYVVLALGTIGYIIGSM